MTVDEIRILWAIHMVFYLVVWVLQDRWFYRELRKLASKERENDALDA